MAVDPVTLAANIRRGIDSLARALDTDTDAAFGELIEWQQRFRDIAADASTAAGQCEHAAVRLVDAAGGSLIHAGLRYTIKRKGKWVADHDKVRALVASRAASRRISGESLGPGALEAATAAAELMGDLYVWESASPNATPIVANLRAKMADVAEWTEFGQPILQSTPVDPGEGTNRKQ